MYRLDSRQRKKKHTEDLEKEKGDWQERMAGLEEDLANMRLQAEAYAMDRVEMEQQFGQAQQQIQGLIYEKEDLVAEHTRETGELRKKINILTEKLSAKASGTATVTPCSTDFTDFASDMNSLTMDQDEWNNYIFVDPLFQDQDATPHHQQPAQSNNSLVVASRPKPQQLLDADKPVASGLLLMLLLCGAYVATQSSGSQAPPGFRVTGEVRAGAQAVLNDILQEASPAAGQSAHHVVANHMNGLEPGPSAVAASWQPKATLSQAEFASISNPSGLGLDASHLDHLHHNLVMPTKDQEAEQLFSLTANQYNSLTSTEFNRPAYHMASDTPPTTDEGSTSPTSGRKTLAQALQSRHDDHSKAAVYTRSLLGEQIPADIVKEFQKMVRDSESSGQHIVKSET